MNFNILQKESALKGQIQTFKDFVAENSDLQLQSEQLQSQLKTYEADDVLILLEDLIIPREGLSIQSLNIQTLDEKKYKVGIQVQATLNDYLKLLDDLRLSTPNHSDFPFLVEIMEYAIDFQDLDETSPSSHFNHLIIHSQ